MDTPIPRPQTAVLIVPVWPAVRGALIIAATVGVLRMADRLVPAREEQVDG